MDVIKLAGSEPANFLDVGGGATKETVAAWLDSPERSEREGHLHQYLRWHCSLRADCPWRDRSGQGSKDHRTLSSALQGTNVKKAASY